MRLFPRLCNGSCSSNVEHSDTKGNSPKTVEKAKPVKYSTKLDESRGVHCSNVVLIPDSCVTKRDYEWSPSSNDDFYEHIPTYTIHHLNNESFHEGKTRIHDSADAEDKEDMQDQLVKERTLLLSVVKEKQKKLPNSKYVANFHILINEARSECMILPLIRETGLDEVASDYAKQMIDRKKCEHSDIEKLIPKMSDSSPPWQRIGENVCQGKSVEAIHEEILKNPDFKADKNNMFDPRFSSFGVGIANSSEGEMYICQIYRG